MNRIFLFALFVGYFGKAEFATSKDKFQIITCYNQRFDERVDTFILDLKDNDRCKNPKCATFDLPRYKDNSKCKLAVINMSNRHIAVYNPSQYDNVKEIHFHRKGEFVEMSKLSNDLGGWTATSIIGPTTNIVSLLNSYPLYVYVMCTTRKMPMRDEITGELYYYNSDPNKENNRYDYVATVDVNPYSPTLGTIVNRAQTNLPNQEFHHGYSSDKYIIATGLYGSSINIFELVTDRRPVLIRVILPEEVKLLNLSSLHTTLQLENGDYVITALSDAKGKGKGGFITLNGDFTQSGNSLEYISPIPQDFEYGNPLSNYISPLELKSMDYNYDITINECKMYMISTEWTNRYTFEEGFLLSSNTNLDKYGTKVNIWNTMDKTFITNFDYGLECLMPLEVRQLRGLNNEKSYVGCVVNATDMSSGLVGIYYDNVLEEWKTLKNIIKISAIPIPPDVAPIELPMFNFTTLFPPIITDITISLDNHFIYISTWLAGYVYQFNIEDYFHPIFVDRILLGGFPTIQPIDVYFNETRLLNGGPQMLRLSPDGTQLYVTNSLYSSWDQEFFGYFDTSSRSIDRGSYLLRLKTGVQKGKKVSKMKIDSSFFIDFANEPGGPTRAHEVHFKSFGNAH